MISIARIKLGVVYGANLESKIAIKIEKKRCFSGTFWNFLLNISKKIKEKLESIQKIFGRKSRICL